MKVEIYSLIRMKKDKSQVFVIQNVTPKKLTIQNIETGEINIFDKDEIINVEVDYDSGELVIEIK